MPAGEYFLVLAPVDDIHAQAVVREAHLRGSTQSQILDLTTVGATTNVSWRYGQTTLAGDLSSTLENATSIWWRRPSTPKPSFPDDPATEAYCTSEYTEFLTGIWAYLDNLDKIRNSAKARAAGNSKVHQLSLARQAGLSIPQTLITSDPRAAETFLAELEGQCIAKGFGGTRERFSPTQLVDSRAISKLAALTKSPVIFQERIPRRREFRVTWVASQLFTAEVQADFEGASIDWRVDSAAVCVGAVLPEPTASRLVRLLKGMGLFYATVDLIESHIDGEIYFLEINEGGQYLFVEMDTGMPISAAIASGLLKPSV